MILDSSFFQIDFKGAEKYALDRLTHELSPSLSYHSFCHTKSEVVEQVALLAAEENLSVLNTALVHTAAVYHDIGFIVIRDDHERISAQIAASVLPRYGFNQDHTNMVKGMIMATRLPQKPQNHLEEIVADADLDLLGRADYFIRNRKLRMELALEGHLYSDENWYRNQLFFLQNHRYFTAAARRLRSAQKHENIKQLYNLCNYISDYTPQTPVHDLYSPILQRTPL